MTGKFNLTIELGNSAMRTQSHVAAALRKLADDLAYGRKEGEGKIMDVNGNSVGKWAFEDES